MKYILFWIGCGIISSLLGFMCDSILYKKRIKTWTMLLPLILGPIAFYFLIKAIYYGLKLRKVGKPKK